MLFFEPSLHTIEVGGKAVKTPGGGFVLTRFLLPFHRLEKEEPVRLEDRKLSIQIEHLFPLPQEYEVIQSFLKAKERITQQYLFLKDFLLSTL